MDIKSEVVKMPAIKYDSVIIMNSGRFQKICKEIYLFSDKIEIMSVGDILYFKAHNTNVNQEICIKPTNTSGGIKYETCDNRDEVIQGVFDLKCLVQFSKCANLSNTVKLCMKNDKPLIVECEVAQLGNVRMCLMPIDEDAK
jgi:proliferating cell nuclear antigen